LRWAILDTDIYIGHFEKGRHAELLSLVERTFVVRHSAVVLSELRRGARTATARRLVERLWRTAAARWEPAAVDWWDAGRLVQQLGDREGWDRGKRRDFQNDALIALTARRHGATVVTANRSDFSLLSLSLGIPVLNP
jgi:predicted nucleic acid-binding protein